MIKFLHFFDLVFLQYLFQIFDRMAAIEFLFDEFDKIDRKCASSEELASALADTKKINFYQSQVVYFA